MIYDSICKEIEKYLGNDKFVIKYANNLDTNWEMILPNEQEKTCYGVLKVDSGITTQVSDRTIRVEQLSLIVAIPAKRDIFNESIVNLKSMLNGLNNAIVYDTDESAMLLFGEYQDAEQQLINGCYWWISRVVFSGNFYDSLYISTDSEVKINDTKLNGIIDISYTREFVLDSFNQVNNPVPKNKVNSIKKSMMVNAVCLKSDTLVSTLIDNEDNVVVYSISYDNGIKTRTFNALLSTIHDQVVTGDVVKLSLTFVSTNDTVTTSS